MHTQVTTPTSGTSAAKTVAALAAAVLALLLVDQATRGPFSAHDSAIVAWFASHRSGTLDGPLRAASLLGGPSATSVYAAIAVAWYLVRRRIGAAIAIGILIYGGALLNAAIKETVHRGRPVVEDFITLRTFSFPSGHAAASTLFAGLLWWIAWSSGWRRSRGVVPSLRCRVGPTGVPESNVFRSALSHRHHCGVAERFCGSASGSSWLIALASTCAGDRPSCFVMTRPLHAEVL